MSGVVQHKSISSGFGASSVDLAFDSPVTVGNRIIAALRLGNSAGGISDGSGNVYNLAQDYAPTISNHLSIYSAIVVTGGDLLLTAALSGDATDEITLHIFEIAGYSGAEDQLGTNFQSNTKNATVSTADVTSSADQFVFAFFADTFGSGVTWTAGDGFAAGETSNGGAVCFSESMVASSTGIQTATANADFASDTTSIIVTFKAGGDSDGSGNGESDTPSLFLGSVVQDDSAPLAGEVFLGTVQVVESGPGGNNGQFLGSVKLRNTGTGYSATSAHGGPHYPWRGQVVIVESGPDGEDGPSLGLVDTQ